MTSIEAGELLEERRRHRFTVIRMAATYTPGAIIVLVLLGISISSLMRGNVGAVIPAIILGLVGAALAFQAIAALRDLPAEPTTTTGTIRRAWTKGLMLGFFRSHYVLVERNVFDISFVAFSQLFEGDRIEVRHWPHTKTVIEVRKLKADRTSRPPSDGPRQPRDIEGEARSSMDAAIGRIQSTPPFTPPPFGS